MRTDPTREHPRASTRPGEQAAGEDARAPHRGLEHPGRAISPLLPRHRVGHDPFATAAAVLRTNQSPEGPEQVLTAQSQIQPQHLAQAEDPHAAESAELGQLQPVAQGEQWAEGDSV